MVRLKDFELANERARKMRKAFPRAVAAYYDRKNGRIVVELSSKLAITFRPQDAQGLERAQPSDLKDIEISPSGFGVHFPSLDADLYVPGLLEGLMGSRQWMAAQLGQAGGQSRSLAKKAASRANGKLGGRPRKRAKGIGA